MTQRNSFSIASGNSCLLFLNFGTFFNTTLFNFRIQINCKHVLCYVHSDSTNFLHLNLMFFNENLSIYYKPRGLDLSQHNFDLDFWSRPGVLNLGYAYPWGLRHQCTGGTQVVDREISKKNYPVCICSF